MITYFILSLILGYSGWVLYSSFKNKAKGKCDSSCSECSTSNSCNTDSEITKIDFR
ncbi:FeoB-associated Cys-rich membrane protein [Vulcanibacillus modesticaldus]|uniref:FeoB-associated Cys-rich membrane protein n=1 Tax=Vulcanibacillus modesticaldus TaxID=337097 RepID=UPI000A0305E3